jgi:hypothetical protein
MDAGETTRGSFFHVSTRPHMPAALRGASLTGIDEEEREGDVDDSDGTQP